MPINVESSGSDEMYPPPEISEERLAELQALVDRRLICETHDVKLGQPHKEGDGHSEQVGVYLVPHSTGVPAYLNDLSSWGKPSFEEEEFFSHLRMCVSQIGVRIQWL